MIDTKKYQAILECILSGQVPSNEISLYFKDEKFYQYYKERTEQMTDKNGFVGSGIYDETGELIVRFIAPGWKWSPLKLGCHYIADGNQFIRTYKKGKIAQTAS